MPTLLDRYRAGDCTAVWDELHALGAEVRSPSVYDDAIAVARETVRRAQENFLTIIRRLDEMGYRFEDSQSSAEEAEQSLEDLADFARAFEPKARAAVENFPVGGEAKSSMERLLSGFQGIQAMLASAKAGAKPKSKRQPPRIKDHTKDSSIICKPRKNVAEQLARFQKNLGGTLPLILEAWYLQIGSLYLFGSHPVICPKEGRPSLGSLEFRAVDVSKGIPKPKPDDSVLADPFAMYPFDPGSLAAFRQMSNPKRRREYAEKRLRDLDENLARTRATISADFPDVLASIETKFAATREQYVRELEQAEKPMDFQMTLGPDDLTKAGISGDAYYVALPDPGADFAVIGATGGPMFITYLRRTFECGGFPGWHGRGDRPAELEKLSEGLLPV